MKFSDLFVPRWQNSDPEVRRRAVLRLKDTYILNQIVEKDESIMVRDSAKDRIKELTEEKVTVDA